MKIKNIKGIVFYCFLFFLFCVIFSYSDDVLDYDGNRWVAGPKTFNTGLVYGYLIGLSNLDGVESFLNIVFSNIENSNLHKSIVSSYINKKYILKITTGQIYDGLENFYKDFSTRKIKVIDAIYIVKMQIQGKSPTLIESQIRYLKMMPISKDITAPIWKKYPVKLSDMEEAIRKGLISKEEFLKIGYHVNEDFSLQNLFCYGNY